MKMTIGDQATFPKAAAYIKNELPKIADIPFFSNAIMRVGEINLVTLKSVLKWNNGPDIKLVAGLGACGEFTPGTSSNEIRIETRLFTEFEAGGGKEKTAAGKTVYVLGVTLLHELMHWGDDQDGVQRATEDGNDFERAVYGKIIPC